MPSLLDTLKIFSKFMFAPRQTGFILGRCCWVHRTTSYGPPFYCRIRSSGQLSADTCRQTVFCQVFVVLPTGSVPSTTNLTPAFTQIASAFLSTIPQSVFSRHIPNCHYTHPIILNSVYHQHVVIKSICILSKVIIFVGIYHKYSMLNDNYDHHHQTFPTTTRLNDGTAS